MRASGSVVALSFSFFRCGLDPSPECTLTCSRVLRLGHIDTIRAGCEACIVYATIGAQTHTYTFVRTHILYIDKGEAYPLTTPNGSECMTTRAWKSSQDNGTRYRSSHTHTHSYTCISRAPDPLLPW